LRWHSVFWDEQQWLPLPGLDSHLLLIRENNPAEGQAASEYVSAGRQGWAAQSAQIELDARRLEQCHTVQEIAAGHAELTTGELEGPTSGLLLSLREAGRDTAAALAQVSIYNQRLVFGQVIDRLNGLYHEIIRSNDPYANRFLPVVIHWRQLVTEHANQLAILAETRREIKNPYVVGPPLTRQQEIFVGRKAISARIEELLRDQDHPPLLLYGQRRMGKTSLLNQLKWLLPQRIVPLVIDLQGPVALAGDHAGFLYNLAKGMIVSARQQALHLPPLTRDILATDPFTLFDDWLDRVEAGLIGQGRDTILLALNLKPSTPP
jgi:hypothetical protein